MATFFFCGIGGIGMSAIALYLQKKGHRVLGSDRSFDANNNLEMKERLLKAGISLFAQDGSGITDQVNFLIVSSAVEESIPDVKKALELSIPVKKRATLLADIFHSFEKKIAVAGTSGKTSVTAMTAHILYQLEKHPVMINGGIMRNVYHNEEPSNLIYDTGDIIVIESDESDGSIELYNPYISVLNNISLDHKPLAEIKPLFERFLERAELGCVINLDCEHTKTISLPDKKIVSFSVEKDKQATLYASDVFQTPQGISFKMDGEEYTLPFIGIHNLSNALAAVCACLLLDIKPKDAFEALKTFKGTHRRLEKVGETGDVIIIDDYAHNEEKIKAALSALKVLLKQDTHLFVVFQPHGFAPLKLMKDGLIQMLKNELSDQVSFLMLPVYYAGGTVDKSISSFEVIEPLFMAGKNAVYFETRSLLKKHIVDRVKSGDVIAVMGARDASLSDFARSILETLKEKEIA
ncbi:MAG: UDP-N-acetylmuramate--alanine ligase [Alphaproteobacteria bacterium]|nr:UDP-N-acetylmuramate--alanine ligase [Alphaproteobacteria bacterium]